MPHAVGTRGGSEVELYGDMAVDTDDCIVGRLVPTALAHRSVHAEI
jgi:hypothetical protein